jgi:hypothetical protein
MRLTVAIVPLLLACAGPASKPRPGEIALDATCQELVAQLQSDCPHARNQAHAALLRIDLAALPAVEEALQTADDPDLSDRLERIRSTLLARQTREWRVAAILGCTWEEVEAEVKAELLLEEAWELFRARRYDLTERVAEEGLRLYPWRMGFRSVLNEARISLGKPLVAERRVDG